jgi:Zn-dependent protease with chaperone function
VLATFRAAVSLLALIGFYVFAVALIAGVMIGAFLLRHTVPGMYWVIAIAAGAGIVIIATLLAVATSRPQLKPGVDVTPEDAPDLWALVTELSDVARTRGPEHIRLVGDVNAAVSEDSRFLGLFGGPRRMYLGVPLLQGLSVTQLRAALAHEFGHYSSAHTRLGPIAYRGWQAVVTTVQQLHGNAFQWPLRLYAGFYILMSQGMSRSQEREADRLMVQIAGRSNAQGTLREINAIAAAWSYYHDEYLSLGWGLDLAPTADGFFGGFEKLLTARTGQLDALRNEVPPEEPAEKSAKEIAQDLLESHPPIAVRIAAMETLPDRADAGPDDGRRACALIPDFAKAAAATAEQSYVFGYRERLEWDDLWGRVVYMDDQRTANTVYKAAAVLTEEQTATLGTVVALSEAGRSAELVRAAFPDVADEQVGEAVNVAFRKLVRAAAVHAGTAGWRMPWSGSAELVKADAEVLDGTSFGARLAGAGTAAEAASSLAALGVDVTTVGPVPVPEVAHVGEVVGGIGGMKGDGATYDVLILDTGLVLAETPSETGDAGSARLDILVRSGSVAQIVARQRFVPYASMASAKVSGWLTVKAKIALHDGTALRLKEKWSSDYYFSNNSDDVLKYYLRRCV